MNQFNFKNYDGTSYRTHTFNNDSLLIDSDGNILKVMDILAEQKFDAERHLAELYENKVTDIEIYGVIVPYLKKYIYFTDDADYYLLASTAILSYMVHLFERIPYIWLNGPKGTGKTVTMSVLSKITYHSQFTSSISAASIYRLIERDESTLYFDEFENFTKRKASNEHFSKIINSGYEKNGKSILTINENVEQFSTYGLKIFAGIHDIIDTIADRSIRINLEKPDDPSVILRNMDDFDEYSEIANQIIYSIDLKLKKIDQIRQNKEPLEIPSDFKFRDLDKWYPILVIAKVYGNDWIFNKLVERGKKDIHSRIETERFSRENFALELLKEFINSSHNERIKKDGQSLLVSQHDFYEYVKKYDPERLYRSKADLTKVLKTYNIVTDRRRFGGDPIILYKVNNKIFTSKA